MNRDLPFPLTPETAPYVALLSAMVNAALADFAAELRKKAKSGGRKAREKAFEDTVDAYSEHTRWLFETKSDKVVSCAWACNMIGISQEDLLRNLRRNWRSLLSEARAEEKLLGSAAVSTPIGADLIEMLNDDPPEAVI